MFRRIVIGVDLLPQSEGALRAGIELAAREHGEATVVHVLAPPIEGRVRSIHAGGEATALEQLKEQIRRVVADVEVRAVVRSGYPPDVICTLAAEQGADLVVVGLHGRRDGVGSVTERVVRLAGRPVLVVPA